MLEHAASAYSHLSQRPLSWPTAEVRQDQYRGAGMRAEAAGRVIRGIISATDPFQPVELLATEAMTYGTNNLSQTSRCRDDHRSSDFLRSYFRLDRAPYITSFSVTNTFSFQPSGTSSVLWRYLQLADSSRRRSLRANCCNGCCSLLDGCAVHPLSNCASSGTS